MTTITPLSTTLSTNTYKSNPIHTPRCHLSPKSHQPINLYCLKCSKFQSFHKKWPRMKIWAQLENGFLFRSENAIFWGEQKLSKKKKRVVVVKFSKNFGFNGGGGKRDEGANARVLGNLGLAVGLTYLTMSGQLGWVLDTIVSLWLLSVVIPVVGLGAFFWWARRDIVQSTCPNCGNAFQVFKSTLNDELQLCPFCSQPFSVEGNEFVKEPIQFSSNRSTAYGQTFGDVSPWSKKGKDSSTTVVDVEAEIKDAE